MDEELRLAVVRAASRDDVRAAVGEVYAQLAKEVDVRRPLCIASGRCCRFEEFGHRLYVTTIELAAFVAGVGEERGRIEAWDGTGCPFQVNKLCGVHAIRPFGCRVFFCDATADEWQKAMYERFHQNLRELHGRLDVPYFYVKWRRGLRAVLGEQIAREKTD